MARPSNVYVSNAPSRGNAALMFRIDGLAETLNALKELPKAMQRTPILNALKKAGEPTRALAAATAPESSEPHAKKLKDTIIISTRLRASQKVKRGLRARRDVVEVYVGSTSPVAHLVEFGTVERFRTGAMKRWWMKKHGRGDVERGLKRPGYLGSTGHMPGSPFMTRAWDSTKAGALDITRRELWNEVVKAARRLRKRAEKGTLSIRTMREMQRM